MGTQVSEIPGHSRFLFKKCWRANDGFPILFIGAFRTSFIDDHRRPMGSYSRKPIDLRKPLSRGSLLPSKQSTDEVDVIVVGGGIAGMATSIHLAHAGLRVVCVHSDELSSEPVGESLDWSAPNLLESIGLPIDALIERGIATTKRHVTLRLPDGSERHYVPGSWLGKFPFSVRLDTIHVDRSALAHAIHDRAERECVQIIADQVIKVEQEHGRVISVGTKRGLLLHARWFIDASGGAARLFARVFDLPMREYGPSKVAMWEYFPTSPDVRGTTLYSSASTTDYMDWIWQIPVRPGLISVGCVTTGEDMRQQRQSGLAVQQIYQGRLRQFPALASLVEENHETAPRVTSFRCRVHGRVSGLNWLIVGEAAAMVDPMTSNGVTAALRHASEAAALVIRNRRASRLPRMAAAAYAWRVRDVAAFFNSLIERVMYETDIRMRIGALAAGDAYTIPAWLMNLIYSRTRPTGVVGSACLGALMRFLSCSAWTFSWFCRITDSAVLRD
jgi:flavin-dependent dehydrogenase